MDKEHVGKIEYIPNPGFPVEYFPFRGQKDYVSPVVAIKFNNLTRNVTFNIVNSMRNDQNCIGVLRLRRRI